jgi:hypothetical protein
MSNDTQHRELALNVQAWQEIENAGHNTDAVEAYRANVGEIYSPLWGAGEDGEAVMKWEDWIGEFDQAYQGQMSTSEFAKQLADEIMPANGSEFLMRYFDYAKFERDLFMGDYWESNGYIFRSI